MTEEPSAQVPNLTKTELKGHLTATMILLIMLAWNAFLWSLADQIGVFLIIIAQALFFLGVGLINDSFHRIFLHMTPGKLYVMDVLIVLWAITAFLFFRAEAVTCLALGCPTVEELALDKLVAVTYFIFINSYFIGCLYQALKMVVELRSTSSKQKKMSSTMTNA